MQLFLLPLLIVQRAATSEKLSGQARRQSICKRERPFPVLGGLLLMLVAAQFVESSAEAHGELFRGAAAPVVEKNDNGLSAKHVVVKGDDVQLMSAKRLQYRGKFGFAHGDVTSDLRVGLVPSKSSPGVESHARVNRRSMLFEIKVFAAQGELVDGAEGFALAAHDVVQGDQIECRPCGSG